MFGWVDGGLDKWMDVWMINGWLEKAGNLIDNNNNNIVHTLHQENHYFIFIYLEPIQNP